MEGDDRGGDDLRRLLDLLDDLPEILLDSLQVLLADVDPVDDVADEEADVVERIVELMGHAGSQLAERGELPGLHQLLLLLAQLVLAAFHLRGCFAEVAHDVDHRLAAGLEPQVGLV